MKNNLKLYLMSALCCIALINTQGQSMHNNVMFNNNQNSINNLNFNTPNKGLQNIGATCYMNATIQCLASIPSLLDALNTIPTSKLNQLRDAQEANKQNAYDCIKLIKDLNNPNSSQQIYLDPTQFKTSLSDANPLFAGIQANDSKDLVLFLLENLHNHLNNPNQNYNNQDDVDQRNLQLVAQNFYNDFNHKHCSIISKLFYGSTNAMTQCANCKSFINNMQCFNILIFPLNEVYNYKYYNNSMQNPFINNKTKIVTIDDCFQYNEKVDLMTGENNIYCNYCKQHASAFMSNKLVDLPQYLILNLNRGKGIQYDVNYKTPEFVDLGRYAYNNPQNAKYRLMGVIVHLGPSGQDGHFIAYTKKYHNAKWYKYNDAIVNAATTEEISKLLNGHMRSYVLLYEKIDNNIYNEYKQREILNYNQPLFFDQNNFQQLNLNNNNIFSYQQQQFSNIINNSQWQFPFNNQNFINTNLQNNQQSNNSQHQNLNNQISQYDQIEITSNIEDIEAYINNNQNKSQQEISNDEYQSEFVEFFFYQAEHLEQIRDDNQLKDALSKLLRKTALFLHDYSVQHNSTITHQIKLVWYTIKQYITNHQDLYYNFMPYIDNVCKLLPKYGININDIQEEQININNLQEQFDNININQNNGNDTDNVMPRSDMNNHHSNNINNISSNPYDSNNVRSNNRSNNRNNTSSNPYSSNTVRSNNRNNNINNISSNPYDSNNVRSNNVNNSGNNTSNNSNNNRSNHSLYVSKYTKHDKENNKK